MDMTLEELCRLCGEHRTCSYDVFMKTEDNLTMSEVIRDLLHISISKDDTIPQQICAVCHMFLVNFLKFRDTADKTQLFLLDLELNLKKEKCGQQTEQSRNSVDSIKSELSANVDDTFDAASRVSFSSDDENVPLIKVAKRTSKRKKPNKSLPWKCFQEKDNDDNSFGTENVIQKQENDYESVEMTIESPLDNPEECNICQKQFSKERYLRHHLRITHKIVIEANYPCNRCTRKFMQKLSWERHQKLHDDPDFNKPVSCEICGKFYINKQTLKAHVRSIHVDISKKYVCEECGAQFKGISSLKTHKITHTGEFPFQCPKCDRRFQSKANLFVHMDTHTETPYVCEICQKPSTTLRGLRLHMINHSDEKPHKCHMCGNAYKRVTALKKHLIVHSGIKPYSCNFCERTFADGSNKRIHMRRLHKKELAEMEMAGMKVIPAVLPKIQQLREDAVTVQG